MGSPLLLGETVRALEPHADGADLQPATNRTDVFSALEESVYERERTRHGHTFADQVQRGFLQDLAGEMLAANVRGFDWTSIKVAAEAAVENVGATDADRDRLSDHHFLTVAAADSDVHFNHQVFREYF